jgi:F-type H+-transporting ATPase subunit epsilon
MAQEAFHLSIVLPTKKVFEGEVSEVILPAFDGETGILPKHENFIGVLGAGALKYVHQGKDFWLAVSSGIFKVVDGKLSVVAEYVVKGEEIKEIEDAPGLIKSLEDKLAKGSSFDGDAAAVQTELQQTRAKLEVYRRTHLLN